MLEFIFGLSFGIYLGTYYNCKPLTECIVNFIKNKIPDKYKK